MDLSRAPRGRDELSELVRWARVDPGAREQHWVEWKGEVDLKDKAWQAKIAKFVLGTSNRPKRIWDLAAEGRAYMLLGVKPGSLRDTVLPDSAVFEKGVNKYLGADRPRWLAIQLEVDGTQVAVITVEPPEPGHRPYVARNGYTPIIEDGRIYIRRNSETIQAGSGEIDEMFRERDAYVRGAGPSWALRLEVEKSSLIVVDVSAPTVQEWLDAERADLVGSLLPRDSPMNAMFSKGFGESRTREEFHQEVEAYLEEAQNRVRTEVLWRLLDAGVSGLQLIAHNDGDDNLLELEVELILPGDADAAGYPDDVRWERLPERPRRWGSASLGAAFLRPMNINPAVRSGVAVRAADVEVRVKLPKIEVRPRNSTELQPVTILLPAVDGRIELEVLWRATARDMRGVMEGSFVVPVEGEAVMSKLLSREQDDETG